MRKILLTSNLPHRAPTATEFRDNLHYCFDVAKKTPINITRHSEVFVLMTREYYAKLINRISGAIDPVELANVGSFIKVRTETLNTALPTLV